MKTKTFFVLCLLLGFGLTQGSAQSYSYWEVWDQYAINVYCDGELVDNLTGETNVHTILHFNNQDELVWARQQFNGELTSNITGEGFTVTDEFVFDEIVGTGTGHCNLIGDAGSHYILTYTWDPLILVDYGLTIVTANCIGE